MQFSLTHWGRVTHICVGKLTIIGSDNDLSPERRQAIIWTNAGILLFGPLGTNFTEILIEIQTFSLKKTLLKMSSAKCCSFRLGLNVLIWLAYYEKGRWLAMMVESQFPHQYCPGDFHSDTNTEVNWAGEILTYLKWLVRCSRFATLSNSPNLEKLCLERNWCYYWRYSTFADWLNQRMLIYVNFVKCNDEEKDI